MKAQLIQLLVFTALVAMSGRVMAELGKLPLLEAEDLNEKHWVLPGDLTSEHTLLLIAFKREQQGDLNTWIDGMDLKNSDLPWLELPVLEDYGSWFKWFVDNGMRRGIKTEFDRSKVVTVYTSKEFFNSKMRLPTEDTVYAVVVNRQGKVIDRELGRYTSAAADRLRNLLVQSGGDTRLP